MRIAAIAAHYRTTFKELYDRGLRVLCLLGQDATLCAASRSGKVEPTALYRQIYEAAGDLKPRNISVDTLSRAFAGNEIDRVQVYGFANHMQALAQVANGSVTVLSHPSLQGVASGTGISGSTAWHGAFRFRQYLKGAKATDSEQPDDDLRELEFKKNQYGPRAETVVVRYRNGLFLPEAGMSNLEKAARETRAEEVFLDILKRFEREGRNVSDKANSPDWHRQPSPRKPRRENFKCVKPIWTAPCVVCSPAAKFTSKPTAGRLGLISELLSNRSWCATPRATHVQLPWNMRAATCVPLRMPTHTGAARLHAPASGQA